MPSKSSGCPPHAVNAAVKSERARTLRRRRAPSGVIMADDDCTARASGDGMLEKAALYDLSMRIDNRLTSVFPDHLPRMLLQIAEELFQVVVDLVVLDEQSHRPLTAAHALTDRLDIGEHR